MSLLIRRGDLVFDIGAHTGVTATAYLAAGARVVCVEPQPQCAATLRRKFKGARGLTIVEQGLGAREGTLTMSICSRSDVLSTFREEWKTGRFAEHTWDRQLEVAITTLDRMIGEHGVPRYCKIDVEGYELEVLRGLSQPVPYLSIEYAREFGAATEACVRRLETLGNERFNVARADSDRLVFTEWCSATDLLKWLDAEDDPLAWGDIYASSEAQPDVTMLPRRRPGLLRRVLRRLADRSR